MTEIAKFTPGPWFVRTRESGGVVVDCFVAAPDVNGFAYDAEILGDDEYRDGIDRQLADARLIAACPTMYDFIARIAAEGNAEAAIIVEAVHASR